MNRSCCAAAALLAALAAGACSPASTEPSPADLAAISALRAAYIAAVTADDPERVAALYTDDGVRMEDNHPAVTGRDGILVVYKSMMASYDCDISITPDETQVTGDWAFDRGQYMMHMMPKTPGVDMIMDQGKYLAIFRKQGDGTWKIAREIGNSNVPLPPRLAPEPVEPKSGK